MRCVAFKPTEGLSRGLTVFYWRGCDGTCRRGLLGRMCDLEGTIDDKGPIEADEYWPIHANHQN